MTVDNLGLCVVGWVFVSATFWGVPVGVGTWSWPLLLSLGRITCSETPFAARFVQKVRNFFLNKQESHWIFLRYHTPLFFFLSASSLRTFLCPSFPQWFFGSRACLCKSCSSDGKSDWEISRVRVLVTAALEGWHPSPPPLPPQKFSAIEYPSVVAVVTSSFTLAVPRSTFASRAATLQVQPLLICHLHAIQPLGYALTTPAVSWIRLRTGW